MHNCEEISKRLREYLAFEWKDTYPDDNREVIRTPNFSPECYSLLNFFFPRFDSIYPKLHPGVRPAFLQQEQDEDDQLHRIGKSLYCTLRAEKKRSFILPNPNPLRSAWLVRFRSPSSPMATTAACFSSSFSNTTAALR